MTIIGKKEGYNKFLSKNPRMEGFLYWINKANVRAELVRPPCYPHLWRRRGFLNQLRSRITHFFICRHVEPWNHLPHKRGCWVEGEYLDEYLEKIYPKPPL